MKHNWLRCAMLGASAIPWTAGAQPITPSSPIPGQVVVRLLPGTLIGTIASEYGATVAGDVPGHDLYLLDFGQACPLPWAALTGDARLAWIEMNFIHVAPEGTTQSFFVSVAPSLYTGQYAAQRIGLSSAQQASLGAGSTVAVLDTGLAADFAPPGSTVLPGYNFVENNAGTADVGNGMDDDGDQFVDELVGHGTMVAGIVVLLAPHASVLPIRVINSDGVGSSFYTAAGILYATDRGADVVNLSQHSFRYTRVVEEAVAAADAAGVLVVASVPNSNMQAPLPYPAVLPGVIAVAATDAADHKTLTSGFGSYVSLCAPGEQIVSLLPGGGHGVADGTSLAAPLVSGAAALVRGLPGAPTPSAVRQALLASARNIDQLNPQYAGMLGHGRLDVAAATTRAGCAGDCNGDGALTASDFGCFQARFVLGDPHADCNTDGALTVSDFGCFQSVFTAGCP